MKNATATSHGTIRSVDDEGVDVDVDMDEEEPKGAASSLLR